MSVNMGKGPKNLTHFRIPHSINDKVYAPIYCMRFPMIGIKWVSSTDAEKVTCTKCLKKMKASMNGMAKELTTIGEYYDIYNG